MTDDIHNEYCKDCKVGSLGPCPIYDKCNSYAGEYAEIKREWELEATLVTENEDGNLETKEG